MAWTAPMTAVAFTSFTASQFNTHIRDNLLETAPAKATGSGSYFVGAGLNSIVERYLEASPVITQQSTSATSYSDLDTVGPSVTVETGTSAIVFVHASVTSDTVSFARMSYQVSGATSITPADNRGIGGRGTSSGASGVVCSGIVFHTPANLPLTPGINTFTAKYRVTGTTVGTFESRRMGVMPL